MRKLVAPALGLLLVFCASSTVNPVAVPLQYKTQADPSEFPSPLNCGGVSKVVVTDSRTNQVIGSRYLQEHTSTRADVTATGDVSAWVNSGADAALRKTGIVAGSGRGPTLRLTVNNIKTDESVYHRAQYTGRIGLDGELVGGNGQSCWHDSVEGVSENYGYAGSAENYQETLNHALDRAMIRILGSGAFRSAVCNCG